MPALLLTLLLAAGPAPLRWSLRCQPCCAMDPILEVTVHNEGRRRVFLRMEEIQQARIRALDQGVEIVTSMEGGGEEIPLFPRRKRSFSFPRRLDAGQYELVPPGGSPALPFTVVRCGDR